MISRRKVLETGGILLAGLLAPRSIAAAGGDVVVIQMNSDTQGSQVGFDPIGVVIQPGQTIRWVCTSNIHTATAYHPKNSQHSLRIPDGAEPWDSKYLFPGKAFEVKLTAEGVYDYFCLPHEIAGMVGRIIVGKPVGPGALPFDYFQNDPEKHGWRNVPKLAQAAFPAIADIMKEKRIPLPVVSGSH
jgi:plastocyanin